MRLDNLKKIILKKSIKEKQLNGTYINNYRNISEAYIIHNPIEDELSATIYGTDLNRIVRITSKDLEFNNLIKSKLNSNEDNIKMYYIELENVLYTIEMVKPYKNYNVMDLKQI